MTFLQGYANMLYYTKNMQSSVKINQKIIFNVKEKDKMCL